ncbi:hypothetical protein L1987_74712 [Smallanthus sonchifolius]|uniref:Uncharacterized protein n=1 Tax=Smallanthus sonchifolius TaxID=185202 RepID=A0ACB9A438_9ASTR|nr:hypothetical protein L1987_74712 [Smallanthus sonchifolius]
MASASKFSIRFQTRSISFPCISHPTTFEIEEQLNMIKTTVAEAASADAICSALFQMTRLYKCMNVLLTSSTTKVLLSREQNKKWVDELVDESVKFLDICGSISDMLSEFKGHNKELVCGLRRRKGELSVENSIKKYNCFRKKMKKDVRGLIGSLKQVDKLINSGGSMVIDSDNHQLAAVIKAVTGVSKVTIMVLESLLTFICVPVSKPGRWSVLVSKLMHKGIMACEDQLENGNVNEFERSDGALSKYGMRNVQIAECSLERLGGQIESMESGVECIFRSLELLSTTGLIEDGDEVVEVEALHCAASEDSEKLDNHGSTGLLVVKIEMMKERFSKLLLR